MFAAGLPFPDVTLLSDAETPLSIASLRGRTVVLYFYPKDDTSGCTMESCEFRDLFPRFSAADAVILGVSPDGAASHRKFKAKYNLPFTLLVDENHALAEQLGIWVQKSMYGNTYWGVQRTTVIIGADGTVRHVFEKVNPAGHAEEVMAFLQGGAEAAMAARAAFDAGTKAVTTGAPKAASRSKASKPLAKRAAKKALKKVAKKPAKKAAKKPAKKLIKKPAKKLARVVRKPAKKRLRQAVKKVATRAKPAKKAAKRAVRRKPATKK